MINLLFLGLLLIHSNLVDAQVPMFGPCPNVITQQNFSANAYLGKWFSAQQYPFFSSLFTKCVTATYGLLSNGSVSVFNQQRTIFGTTDIIQGYATFQSNGKGLVTFPSLPIGAPANYWVLKTDYKNYSVVYSCSNFFIFHLDIVWILTRLAKPPQSIIDTAYAILKTNNIQTFPLLKIDQQNC